MLQLCAEPALLLLLLGREEEDELAGATEHSSEMELPPSPCQQEATSANPLPPAEHPSGIPFITAQHQSNAGAVVKGTFASLSGSARGCFPLVTTPTMVKVPPFHLSTA